MSISGRAIMSRLVHPSNVKYAVIQVSSEADSHGRVILSYSDEQSLCSLIAAPSIIARGFAHREEAATVLIGDYPKRMAMKNMEQEQRVNDNRKRYPSFHFWIAQLAAKFDGWKACSLAYSAVQLVFASAVLALYSKNIVSSVTRTILGI